MHGESSEQEHRIKDFWLELAAHVLWSYVASNENLGFENCCFRWPAQSLSRSFKVNVVGVFVNREQEAHDLRLPFNLKHVQSGIFVREYEETRIREVSFQFVTNLVTVLSGKMQGEGLQTSSLTLRYVS